MVVNFDQVTKKTIPLSWFCYENDIPHGTCVNTTSLCLLVTGGEGSRHVIPTSLQNSSGGICP